jgi:hypothetical protein
MKKLKASRLEQEPPFNAVEFDKQGNLPTIEVANKNVEQLMVQTPIKEVAIGRVKLTTAMLPDVVKWVKVYAAETGVSPADILEAAVLDYQDKKRRNA